MLLRMDTAEKILKIIDDHLDSSDNAPELRERGDKELEAIISKSPSTLQQQDATPPNPQ